jgi:hypothetical protein
VHFHKRWLASAASIDTARSSTVFLESHVSAWLGLAMRTPSAVKIEAGTEYGVRWARIVGGGSIKCRPAPKPVPRPTEYLQSCTYSTVVLGSYRTATSLP